MFHKEMKGATTFPLESERTDGAIDREQADQAQEQGRHPDHTIAFKFMEKGCHGGVVVSR